MRLIPNHQPYWNGRTCPHILGVGRPLLACPQGLSAGPFAPACLPHCAVVFPSLVAMQLTVLAIAFLLVLLPLP